MLKFMVVLFLILAFYQLAMAFRYFLRSDVKSKEKMVHALAWRIGFSIMIFAALIIAFMVGWIAPSSSLPFLIAPA